MNDLIDTPLTAPSGAAPSPTTSTWPAPGTPAETAAGPPPPLPPRRHTGWHVAAIVAGCLALLPGLGLLAGGGTLLAVQALAADADGYVDVTIDRIESAGVAVVTADPWPDDTDGEAFWVADFIDLDLRLRVAPAGPTEEVFVGIARAEDVEAYLGDAARSELVELDGRSPRYRERDGASSVVAPLDAEVAGIWDVATAGPGEQVLEWEARGGRWSVVVMNADGTADVAADVELGGRSGLITPIGVTMLVVGGLLVAGAVVLIVIGARGRRDVDAAASTVG